MFRADLQNARRAWLAMAGVHPKVVQTVMRHSVITLTMDTYGHLFPGQDAAAVGALPSMMNGPRDETEALAATGTDGSGDLIAHAYRQQYSDETTRKSANPRKRHGVCSEASEEPEPVTPAGLSEKMRDVAKVRLLGLEPRTYGLKVRCSTD